jgi:hypothetical protein
MTLSAPATLDTYAVVIGKVAHEAARAAARLLLSQTRLRFSAVGVYEA